VRLVGYRPDAEDAVQETCLAAIRHIGSVRDPESIGAWLQAVVRRACLQHERRRRNGEPPTDPRPKLIDDRPRPEDRIERLELRDWIWGALQRLPEPLRVSAMLRYFGSYDSYDEVATDPRRPDRNDAKPAVRSKDQACRGAARERRAHRRRSR